MGIRPGKLNHPIQATTHLPLSNHMLVLLSSIKFAPVFIGQQSEKEKSKTTARRQQMRSAVRTRLKKVS